MIALLSVNSEGRIRSSLFGLKDTVKRTVVPLSPVMASLDKTLGELREQQILNDIASLTNQSNKKKKKKKGPSTADLVVPLVASETSAIVESSPNTSETSPPVTSLSPPTDAIPSHTEIWRQLDGLKDIVAQHGQTISHLRCENVKLQETIEKHGQTISHLRCENVKLQETIEKHELTISHLKSQISELEQAGAGVMDTLLNEHMSLTRIRHRVLLDNARELLARLCHYTSWSAWKDSQDRVAMFNEARTILANETQALPRVTAEWVTVGKNTTALDMLIRKGGTRERGNKVAHVSSTKDIAQSLIELKEGSAVRTALSDIYRAVYEGSIPKSFFETDD
ncbi:hypothetical protein BDQ12DRAFT_682844 [Crucibulum laeve]|uniref:Uncharacterized protein n=1 Tax=Crucibulum laeve TaxID=68775 RepID=A0A5C3M2N5_9AGAR|nr:hypothetical protein BDQ12DRAFT_682844 [Crucibulum laeve]